MTADELKKLIDSGDTYGLMIASVRAWMERYHPEVNDLVLLGEIGQGKLPGVRIPITASPSSPAA